MDLTNVKSVDLTKIQRHKSKCRQGATKKCWVEFEGEKYLFKAKYRMDEGYSMSDVGEVFNSFLAKKLGIPCVETSFATERIMGLKYSGSISKSYITDDVETSFSGSDLLRSFGYSPYNKDQFLICDCLKKYCLAKNLVLPEETLITFFKYKIFDKITCQIDRHSANYEFLVKKRSDGKRYVEMAPLFDNGLSFLFWSSPKDFNENYGIKKAISFCRKYGVDPYKLDNLDDFIVSEPALQKMFKDLRSLDISSVIKEFESETGYVMEPYLKESTIEIYNNIVKNFEFNVKGRLNNMMYIVEDLQKKQVCRQCKELLETNPGQKDDIKKRHNEFFSVWEENKSNIIFEIPKPEDFGFEAVNLYDWASSHKKLNCGLINLLDDESNFNQYGQYPMKYIDYESEL